MATIEEYYLLRYQRGDVTPTGVEGWVDDDIVGSKEAVLDWIKMAKLTPFKYANLKLYKLNPELIRESIYPTIEFTIPGESEVMPCFCGGPSERGPNALNQMVCNVHCSKCKHDRFYEDHNDFCSICTSSAPPGICSPKPN